MAMREPDLPPGPSVIPFLGNFLQLPKTGSVYPQFHAWAKKYGEIYSLKLGSRTTVVISSPCAVREILVKRAAATANRPPNVLAQSVTDGSHLTFARNGESGRKLRKAANAVLGKRACNDLTTLHIAEAAQFANDILRDSDAFSTSVLRYSCSVVSSIVLDERVPTANSAIISGFQSYLQQWTTFVEPGWTSPPEFMSISKYLPSALTSWKTVAEKIRSLQTSFWFSMLSNEEQENTPCSLWKTVERSKKWEIQMDLAVPFGGALFESGAEPIAAFLHHFTTLLSLHPEILRKCHDEMDLQVGTNRSPTLEDMEALPYLRAVIKEVMRFHPLRPFGIPHASTDEQIYKGYRIPRSATIFVDVWGILRDPELFDSPHVFNPERFLSSPCGIKAGLDGSEYEILNTLPFGFGFRACPGQRLARRTMDLATAKLVWGFDFGIASRGRGKSVALDYSAIPQGPILAPMPFDCAFEPRSVEHADVIQGDFKAACSVLRAYDCTSAEAEKAGPCTKWKLD